MYKFGTIVLVPFPFTDLSSTKLRPAMIISNGLVGDDLILAFISSRANAHDHGIFISEKSPEFKKSGLKVESIIRLDKIATLEKKTVLGEIGSLQGTFLKKYSKVFFKLFGF